MQIDVVDLYKRFPYDRKIRAEPNKVAFADSPFHLIYRSPLLPIKLRKNFYRIARQINLDLTWFDFFNRYWTGVLAGRPLWSVNDLYFLQNLYRMKFQRSQVSDVNDPHVHLGAWQHAEVLYQLLHLVTKDALYEYVPLIQEMYKFGGGCSSFLEFGCATAPITTTIYDFYWPKDNSKFYIADLESIAFHYAAFKFQSCANVIPLLLKPEDNFLPRLAESVDVIFCITVYEHLTLPLEVTQLFHKLLSTNGLLIFDYIKSDGGGMDTLQSVRGRRPTLEFIQSNFNVLSGRIDFDKSMSLTIVRKR